MCTSCRVSVSIILSLEGKLKREGGQLLQQGVEEQSTGAVSPITLNMLLRSYHKNL